MVGVRRLLPAFAGLQDEVRDAPLAEFPQHHCSNGVAPTSVPRSGQLPQLRTPNALQIFTHQQEGRNAQLLEFAVQGAFARGHG